MNNEQILQRLSERMGAFHRDDVEAEMEWSRALLDFRVANAKLLDRLVGMSTNPTTPVREQLSELPGGTYLVARFDHAVAIEETLRVIMAEPVGMLGDDDPEDADR